MSVCGAVAYRSTPTGSVREECKLLLGHIGEPHLSSGGYCWASGTEKPGPVNHPACVVVGCGRPAVKRERCEGCVQKHDAKRIQIATALLGSATFELHEAPDVIKRALIVADLLIEEAAR